MVIKKKRLTLTEQVQLTEDLHMHSVNIHTREIYLNGFISDNEDTAGIDFRAASSFIKNLHILDRQSKATITVHMCIEGGDWGYGMAMFDAIRACISPVNIIVYGLAESMSGVLLQAADKRIMMPNSYFMLHHGSISIDQTSQAALETVKLNEYNCKIMLDIFAQKAINGKYFKEREYNITKVKRYLDDTIKKKGDWYLTAEQAVEYGLADKIFIY
jgi:ATP-dependent protease ClpP protease subunit